MAYPILGTPKPQFFDSSGDPLASGTLTITDTADAAIEVYSSAANADSRTSGTTTAITLGSDGRPPSDIWGANGLTYKVVLKDSAATTIYTLTDIFLPETKTLFKVKTADESLTTTTLAQDTHLQNYYLNNNTYYKITGYFVVTADAAGRDFKFNAAQTGAPQDADWLYISVDSGTAGTVDEGFQDAVNNGTPNSIDIDGTGDVGIIVRGFYLSNVSNLNETSLRVAQGIDAGTTTFKKGSWLKFESLFSTGS